MACIYKISVGDEFYIGSTFDYDERLDGHNKRTKTHKQKLYQAIRDNNNEFVMVKLHDYECETEEELVIEERRVYDEMKPTLNMRRPHITEEERDEATKKQYQDNKEQIILRQRHYQQENAEKIKQYNQTNAEKIALRMKRYNQINKEKIALQRKEKCVCECGCEVAKQELKRHQKSKKHLNWVETTK